MLAFCGVPHCYYCTFLRPDLATQFGVQYPGYFRPHCWKLGNQHWARGHNCRRDALNTVTAFLWKLNCHRMMYRYGLSLSVFISSLTIFSFPGCHFPRLYNSYLSCNVSDCYFIHSPLHSEVVILVMNQGCRQLRIKVLPQWGTFNSPISMSIPCTNLLRLCQTLSNLFKGISFLEMLVKTPNISHAGPYFVIRYHQYY